MSDAILNIIRSPLNGMRLKNPVVLDIKKTDFAWMQLTGCAMWSVYQWLKDNQYSWTEMSLEQIKNSNKKIFALVSEPRERYWRGIIEWSSCFGEYAWWHQKDIMAWFPHFDRYTLRYSELLDQVKVHELIKVDNNLTTRMELFIKNNGLKLELDFPHIRPRYRRVKWVKKVYNFVHPKFKNMIDKDEILNKKLEEYLAPDYHYYEKAN